MTRDNIEDYLYFFWAPLLKANAVNADEVDLFQKMIILTLSQSSVYIEAPDYKAGNSSREYTDDIKNEVSTFADKIFAEIPGRSASDNYWLKITISKLLPPGIGFADTHLTTEQSFGAYKIDGDNFITADFYYLAHQLQLQLPITVEITAVLSTKTPVATPDGPVTNLDIPDCTLWLSALHFDPAVTDASLYISVRLKECNISFDEGYTKSGNQVTAGLLNAGAGFVITCITEDETAAVDAGITVAAGNKIIYPEKFVFTAKNQPVLPQPAKIILTHAEPFSTTIFGSDINTVPVTDINGTWIADKRLLSFPLQTENDVFAATSNVSPVFDLEGSGKIIDPRWYFPIVSTNHALAFDRLGIGSESGYIGFNIQELFSLSWDGLENGALKLQEFFIRSSPLTLLITYTSMPSLLAKQQLKLWQENEKQNARSGIAMNYAAGGTGNFISHRKSNDQHITNAGITINIDRPLLSDGDRVFLKTSAGLMLVRDANGITAVVIGEKMDPATVFQSSAYKRLSSFALTNALIMVNPVEMFILIGSLNTAGIIVAGQCFLTFPVYNIEHILPDPYITSLFNDQPADNVNAQPSKGLKATIRWNEADGVKLILQLSDERGNVFIPKGTITDDQLAERLLQFPLPHPGEKTYDEMLDSSIGGGNIQTNIHFDGTPYAAYQSFYHSKTNTSGAYSTLHILPGNAALVDVSGRASQMGVAFSRSLNNTENGIEAVLANTGYTMNQTFRIDNNELVSSGRFVRAFTLPHVQWEPVYFEEHNDLQTFFDERNPFPFHGVPTRISSANKADVTLAPLPVTKYIVEGFRDEKNKYAAAAHFALPFGMNSVALFHPMVEDVVLPPENPFPGAFIPINPDPYSYTILNFNQPDFLLKKGPLSGAIQIKALSEGYPKIPRDKLPDPSFHGAVIQIPDGFSTSIDNRLQQVIAGNQTATALLGKFLIAAENANFAFLNNISNDGLETLIQYKDDSILGIPITAQFNKQMWGEQDIDSIQVDKLNKKAFVTFKFTRSRNAKVPLRRIDFSGLGASIFSNWLNKTATAGAVSQVKFNILISRVAHEVVQIRSCIIPWFIPVVRTLIIERKNHGSIIRTDTGWVATGPGIFHTGYTIHPGVIKGVYNVSSIKDTEVAIPQKLDNGDVVNMSGVYFDADVQIENVISGFKNVLLPPNGNYKLVPSKKQFGYIILGNPDDSITLENYFKPIDLQRFMSRPDVGALGGPVDCIVNIAGSDQSMHVTRVDVTATASALSVAAARGTLFLPKGGSWSVVKKITAGATLPLTNDETVPLIRNGVLQFDSAGNPADTIFNSSLHVLGNPLEIEKYSAGSVTLASTEYALLQSTDTQKILFPRPSFDSNNNAVITDGITEGLKKVFTTDPLIADPYSLLKSNGIFPDSNDALTLGNVKGLVKSLDIIKEKAGISFPADVADVLKSFTPLECIPIQRKLYLVKEGSFEIYIDYGAGTPDSPKQLFNVALDGNADDHSAGDADPKKWQMLNTDVAIVVNIDIFQPLIIVKGNFKAEAGKKPEFNNASVEWGGQPALQKIVEVLSILYQLSTEGGGGDVIKDGFTFSMGNAPDSWTYKCTIEEKIPVIKFPSPVQLSQLPGPAPLIVEAGLNLGVFFNLSLSTDPNNLIKAGAGIMLGFEATIQVLILSIEVASAYGVGSARVDIFIELPDAKPTFKFTMGFGATVAVQLPVVGYVSVTRVISLGASIDSNGMEMTVGQMLRGVITVAGGLASVSIQVEASGTVTDTPKQRSATVRGVFSLDITVAWVLSWDFSKEFEHTINLPNPF